MKNTFKIIGLFFGIIIMLSSCKGDVNTDLKGQTFTYFNYGLEMYESYTFKNNGNVYNYTSICGISTDTKGCSLYYTLEDKTLTIYYGSKGWKKEVRNTVYAYGQYFEDYLVINGRKFTRD